jgi:type IV secretory pathway VirB10-like protein
MNRTVWIYAFLIACAGTLVAQQGSRDSYEGTSNPPPDSTITTQEQAPPQAKPAPGVPVRRDAEEKNTADDPAGLLPKPTSVDPSLNYPAPDPSDGTDDGIVLVAPETAPAPKPSAASAGAADDSEEIISNGSGTIRSNAAQAGGTLTETMPEAELVPEADPDGDIVSPGPDRPGTLAAGTIISARLKERLSSSLNGEGDGFQAIVVKGIRQGNTVIVPAGSEIRGTVRSLTMGDWTGHGSMVLRPQTLILPNGSRYKITSVVSNAPGAAAHVSSEGKVTPASRMKKDGIEYGAGIATGMVAGGLLAGPAGAFAGTLLGAGVVTFHLMKDHPQAHLEPGTMLEINLTKPLHISVENEAEATVPVPAHGTAIVE